MKFLLFISIIAFTLACSSESNKVEVGKKTSLEVNEVFDAGTVVKGEEIKAVFKIKNTGSYPLVFGEVKASCSCTVAEKPSKPIQPGKTGEIIAKVKTEGISAKSITKSVTILTNTEPSQSVLTIKAIIK